MGWENIPGVLKKNSFTSGLHELWCISNFLQISVVHIVPQSLPDPLACVPLWARGLKVDPASLSWWTPEGCSCGSFCNSVYVHRKFLTTQSVRSHFLSVVCPLCSPGDWPAFLGFRELLDWCPLVVFLWCVQDLGSWRKIRMREPLRYKDGMKLRRKLTETKKSLDGSHF